MVEMKTFASRDEWLKNRSGGIGGSEISAVVGLNPYMSSTQLWEIKTGRAEPEDISDKPYVQFGQQAEDHLRALFALDFPGMKVEYQENNSFTNDRYPWAKASLDGWLTDPNGRKGILEIKTTEVLNSMHKEKWNQRIPNNYYCQCLFYMAVVEADFCILKARLKTIYDGIPYAQVKHYQIERSDVKEDIQYLMTEGEKFWKCVQENNRPPLVLPDL